MKTENKQSNLEKNAGIAGSIKEFIVSKFVPYVPFSFMSKEVMGNWWEKGNGSGEGLGRRMATNILISGCVATAILVYGIHSLSAGTMDYTKWSEISNQRKIQAEQSKRDYLTEQFHELDTNDEGNLSLEEFVYKK